MSADLERTRCSTCGTTYSARAFTCPTCGPQTDREGPHRPLPIDLRELLGMVACFGLAMLVWAQQLDAHEVKHVLTGIPTSLTLAFAIPALRDALSKEWGRRLTVSGRTSLLLESLAAIGVVIVSAQDVKGDFHRLPTFAASLGFHGIAGLFSLPLAIANLLEDWRRRNAWKWLPLASIALLVCSTTAWGSAMIW